MRYGHKFVFMRTRDPDGPSWNSMVTHWQTPALPPGAPDNEIVWTAIWNSLSGTRDRFARATDGDRAPAPGELLAQLRSGDDLERTHAASALGFAAGEDGTVAEQVAGALGAALRDSYEPVAAECALRPWVRRARPQSRICCRCWKRGPTTSTTIRCSTSTTWRRRWPG